MPKLYAIAPSDTKTAFLESEMDLPINERTLFKVKVLSVHEIGKIESLFSDLEGKDEVSGSQVQRLQEGLQLLVKGWTNFKFADGQTVEYKDYKNNLSEIISLQVATELFGAALKANTLDEDDKGN